MKSRKDFNFDSDKDLFFDEDFEVTYEEDIRVPKADLEPDGYKDVLAQLSELDPTGSMDVDYLQENLTRPYYHEDLDKLMAAVSESEDKQETKEKNDTFFHQLLHRIQHFGKKND